MVGDHAKFLQLSYRRSPWIRVCDSPTTRASFRREELAGQATIFLIFLGYIVSFLTLACGWKANLDFNH